MHRLSVLILMLACATALQAQSSKKPQPPVAGPAAPAGKGKLKPVDINHAPQNELQFMLKIDAALASRIIANRPYKSKAELVTKNVMPLGQYQALRKQVAAKQY